MDDSPRHSVGTINHDEPLDEEDLPFDLLNSQEEYEQSQQSSSKEFLAWLQQQQEEPEEEEPEEEDLQPQPSIQEETTQEENPVPSLFISVDLETGGEAVGIVQLSAVAFTLDGQHLGIFNEFVDPQVESKYWSQAAIEVHGIKPSDVALADTLVEVWPRFVEAWAHSRHRSWGENCSTGSRAVCQ